jgi:hypothetical protein
MARVARKRFWSVRSALFVTGFAGGWVFRSAVDRLYHGEDGALVAALVLALLIAW